MIYNDHHLKYANFILENHDEEKWSKFVGRCLLFGVKSSINISDILEYIFENYHSLGLNELPNINQIEGDIKLYLKYKRYYE